MLKFFFSVPFSGMTRLFFYTRTVFFQRIKYIGSRIPFRQGPRTTEHKIVIINPLTQRIKDGLNILYNGLQR